MNAIPIIATRLQNWMMKAEYIILTQQTNGKSDNTSSTPDFTKVTKPIIDLINSLVSPALGLVGAIGAIYCIILGAKLAKAEEPQDREKAKGALKNALVGFILIFVLLVALKLGLPIMQNWYQNVK